MTESTSANFRNAAMQLDSIRSDFPLDSWKNVVFQTPLFKKKVKFRLVSALEHRHSASFLILSSNKHFRRRGRKTNFFVCIGKGIS